MNPLLESLARRGVDCTKGMKMEAPPLPEPKWKPQMPPTAAVGAVVVPAPQTFSFTGYSLPFGQPLFTADQMRQRDVYWMAKVEEAVRDAKQSCIAKAHQIAAHTGLRKHHEMAECLATSIREGG